MCKHDSLSIAEELIDKKLLRSLVFSAEKKFIDHIDKNSMHTFSPDVKFVSSREAFSTRHQTIANAFPMAMSGIMSAMKSSELLPFET